MAWSRNSSSMSYTAVGLSSGSQRRISRINWSSSLLSSPPSRVSRLSSAWLGNGVVAIQRPRAELVISQGWGRPVGKLGEIPLTVYIPVPLAHLDSFNEGLRGWPHERHHLGKMQFVVEAPLLHSAKEPAASEETPDLGTRGDIKAHQAAQSMLDITITPIDHISMLETHSMSRMISGALYTPGMTSLEKQSLGSSCLAAPKSLSMGNPFVMGIGRERYIVRLGRILRVDGWASSSCSIVENTSMSWAPKRMLLGEISW